MPPVNRSRKAGSRAMRTPMVTELMTRAPCLSTICSFPWSCLWTTGSWSESPTHLTSGTTAIRTGTASRTKSQNLRGGKRGGNMEHQPSGLIWNLDNWIYVTYQNTRYRFTNGEFKTGKLPRGGGQWGLTADDDGRIYYSTGGGENPAFFFQQPPVYGMFGASGQTEANFRTVFPIAPVPDAQGGRRRVGPNGGLNAFTGSQAKEFSVATAFPRNSMATSSFRNRSDASSVAPRLTARMA